MFFFANTIHLAAQRNSSIDSCFNDANRSSTKNVLKIDATEILKGNVSIIWEHRVNQSFTFEGGIGLLTSQFYEPLLKPIYKSIPVSELELKKLDFALMSPGYSIYFSPKYFRGQYEDTYQSLSFRLSNYSQQLTQLEIAALWGKQWIVNHKLVFDLSVGLSWDKHWTRDGNYYLHNSIFSTHFENVETHSTMYFSVPISLKVGYRLD
jgi:hypothetical protein